jgi:catechol 2,3-dioxygenase-like lactoylglutathione lyase family enzyme
MLRKVDRLILRVPNLQSAVTYYRDVLGLKVVRQEKTVASLFLLDQVTELVLHTEDDLPAEASYYLVDDVRDMYAKRATLRLTFNGPPTPSSRGYRAAAKDPFGNVILLLDRTAEGGGKHAVEDARAAGTGALFAGVEAKLTPKNDLLANLYEKTGRTADDLPYTPHFESLFKPYAAAFGEPKPTRQETWRHLLNLRKRGSLAKLGEARSKPPEIEPEQAAQLRDMLGEDIGRRDRLPYTDRFDKLVDEFNKTQGRPLSPHLVWRLVATLAK